MQVQPYLDFDGRCEEAIEFYKQAVGAKVEMLMRFQDNPDLGNPDAPPAPEGCGPMPPGTENKIMHSSLRIGDSLVMASDCACSGQVKFQGFSLSLSPSTEADAKRLFDALSEGGQVFMPLSKTFFSPCFGVVSDKFGVSWMIVVQ